MSRRETDDRRGAVPCHEKQREKRRIKEAKSFGEFGEKWLTGAPMADSTRAMRRAIFERELKPVWRNRLLTEITPDDLRAHCAKIVERGAPATAIHVRDILKLIYAFAILHGEKVANPADDVGPASIATFTPKDRALSPTEIRIMLKQLEHVATLPTIRLGMKLYLLTMVRKSDRVTYAVVEQAKKEGLPLEPFTVHDLRRTGSTLLNELGFNRDWIEKCLAHEDGRSSRGVYNKAEYEVQRRHMMQEWADTVDAWVEGRKYVPTLVPTVMPPIALDPAL